MSDAYAIGQFGGMYYVTCTVVGWTDVFTRKKYCDIILDSLSFSTRHKKLSLHAWVIMSNHVHLIASVPDDVSMGDLLRDFKTFTSKAVLRGIETEPGESRKECMMPLFRKKLNEKVTLQFWQNGNHAVSLFSNPVIKQKLDYLHNNPVRAGLVRLPEYYLYSSAIDYAGGNGLVEVEPIIFKEFVR